MKRLLIAATLALLPIVAKAGEFVRVKVAGSVEHSVTLECAASQATLSAALERAGGISASGSDLVQVQFAQGGKRYLKRFRGLEFYRGDVDYQLPDSAEVLVADCESVGLGNLTKEKFTLLKKAEADYLRRRAEGKLRAELVAEASETAK